MKSGSNLEKILEGGYFAVTAEVGPPKGTSASVIQKKGDLLKSCCDALNVTDNQTAIVRMSSLSGCVILKQMGLDPVMQMVVQGSKSNRHPERHPGRHCPGNSKCALSFR